jgi:hypothetical protein
MHLRTARTPASVIGKMLDDIGECGLVELPQRRLDIAQLELQVGVQRIVNRRIADALGGRTKLVGQILLH